MRLKARVDENQKSIVAALRKCGASVAHTHQLGKGFPDLVVAWRKGREVVTALVEIKDGKKSLSQRALTDDEMDFHSKWIGKIYVIETVEQAIEMINEK